MYDGRTPAICVMNIASVPAPLACFRASARASFLTSSFVLACSLKSFLAQPLCRKSNKSWIWNWIRFENVAFPSRSCACFKVRSRAENCDMRTLPCAVASKVCPMACSNSHTHSIMCSSGCFSLIPIRSCTTWPMTFTANSCLKNKLPMNFMLASILSFRFFISIRKSSAGILAFSSSVGSKDVGRLSNSSWHVFSSTRVNVWAFSPSCSGGNSGYRVRNANTMSA
mmetsp:Transcript_84726/g.258699  ORF Transcript_84726/g.258699 Transcript_84726/m.258699 type:complete len:226 (-) Transcript_84726:15-692(-)